jgi:hypothetical protein
MDKEALEKAAVAAIAESAEMAKSRYRLSQTRTIRNKTDKTDGPIRNKRGDVDIDHTQQSQTIYGEVVHISVLACFSSLRVTLLHTQYFSLPPAGIHQSL